MSQDISPELLAAAEDGVKRIMAGEATSGDPLVDFLVRQSGQYSSSLIERYRQLQRDLSGYEGQLVLVSHCWEARQHPVCTGFGDTSLDYSAMHDLWLGELAGDKLVIGQRTHSRWNDLKNPSAFLPTSKWVFRRTPSSSWDFQLHEGNLDLHPPDPDSHRVDPVEYWRWELDLKKHPNWRGSSHGLNMPDESRWWEIAIGDAACEYWLTQGNGSPLTFMDAQDSVAQAFTLLGRSVPNSISRRTHEA